jgi:hypothetical protein
MGIEVNKFPVERLREEKRERMRTFPTFRCTCFVYDDEIDLLTSRRRLLSRGRTSKGRGNDGATDEFQPFPSRHRVFVSAEELMVTIETAPHHYRLPFS